MSIEDIEPQSPPDENIPDGAMATSVGGARQLSEPLDATRLAINHYELALGESFSLSSHRHSNQEEVFYIQSGTATFTLESGDVTVGAGEVLRVPPGTFQFGTNDGDERVTAIALGAPREYEGKNEYLIDCSECDERTVQIFEQMDETSEILCRCTDCGAETHRISH